MGGERVEDLRGGAAGTGLQVLHGVQRRVVCGLRRPEDAVLDEGQEKATREDILLFGEEKFGPPVESVKAQLNMVTDLGRFKRMVRRAVKAASWQEILETP